MCGRARQQLLCCAVLCAAVRRSRLPGYPAGRWLQPVQQAANAGACVEGLAYVCGGKVGLLLVYPSSSVAPALNGGVELFAFTHSGDTCDSHTCQPLPLWGGCRCVAGGL